MIWRIGAVWGRASFARSRQSHLVPVERRKKTAKIVLFREQLGQMRAAWERDRQRGTSRTHIERLSVADHGIIGRRDGATSHRPAHDSSCGISLVRRGISRRGHDA